MEEKELKTLKDIESPDRWEDDVGRKKLKQEAIKYAEELSKPKGHIDFGKLSFSWDEADKEKWLGLAYRDLAKAVIMHLGNITEEDVKK